MSRLTAVLMSGQFKGSPMHCLQRHASRVATLLHYQSKISMFYAQQSNF
jgi:hypothetical protein